MMTKTEASLAALAACLAVTACVHAYTTTTTSSATVPAPAARVAGDDAGVTGAAAPPEANGAVPEDADNCGCCGRRCARGEVCVEGACVAESSACVGGCNPDVYVCNLTARRCVGNGSASVNLCTWDNAVSGEALACGATGGVTFVDACRDPQNCGNCGVVCAGHCFWGECR